MKIGLLGSSGYIAAYLRKSLAEHEILKIDMSGNYDYFLDLSRSEDFDYSLFEGLDYLIFTAAISSPDACQNRYEECWKINVEGTCHVIEEAIRRKVRVLFFSSDAVFGDHPDEVFDENSRTETHLAYGIMKKAVEDRFRDDEHFKAIRLSYVVSKNDKFVSYCLSCLEKHEVCEVFDPFTRNCITISDVTDSVRWLINSWEDLKSPFLNIAGKELISREDIVKTLNRILDDDIGYKVVYPGDAFYASRPKITRMKSLYLYECGIVADLPFEEKLRREFQ